VLHQRRSATRAIAGVPAARHPGPARVRRPRNPKREQRRENPRHRHLRDPAEPLLSGRGLEAARDVAHRNAPMPRRRWSLRSRRNSRFKRHLGRPPRRRPGSQPGRRRRSNPKPQRLHQHRQYQQHPTTRPPQLGGLFDEAPPVEETSILKRMSAAFQRVMKGPEE